MLCLFVWYINKDSAKLNKTLLAVSGVYLLLLMGLRSCYIGDDTYRYCLAYLKYSSYGIEEMLAQGTNYGFTAFTKLISLISPYDYSFYLMTVSTVITLSLVRFLSRHAKNMLFSQMMLLSLGFVYFFMTSIKQTLAISILLFAYTALSERKIVRFLLLVLLAATFHNTAIVFLIALPAALIPLRRAYVAITPALILFVYIIRERLFNFITTRFLSENFYGAYGTVYSSQLNYTGLAIQVVIFIVSLCLLWGSLKEDREAADLIALYSVGMVFQTMTSVLGEFFRLSMYFSIFGVIMLPKALGRLNDKIRDLVTAGCLCAFILYFLFFSSQSSFFIPYMMFFG